jgi:ankyrin repeat protein
MRPSRESDAMKKLLTPLWLVSLVVFNPPAKGDEVRTQSGLSVAIVVGKDENGAPTLQRDGKFQVVFTNRSDKPIRLWSEECQRGYETLSFRVKEEDENTPSLIHKRPPDISSFRNKPPRTITIPSGGTFTWNVHPSAFYWGERQWTGGPEPNTGKPVTLTAVFEIKSTDAAKMEGVWTGRVTSDPVKTLVVDARLRTPHQYLWNDCPKQALRLMRADRTWINKTDKDDDCTPLHHAVRFNFVEVAGWLLAHEADVNARAYNQFTPLHFAHEPKLVKLLVEHKADVNAKDAFGGTALSDAADRYARLERFPDVAAECEKCRTITRMLLDAGADYDLHSACYLDDIERVRVLVKDRKQARDKQVLREAASYGRTKIVKLLLEHGADPEDADYGGLTVSYFAIEHADVLKLLFDAGADPRVRVDYHGNGPGPEGSTLLHKAAGQGCLESAKLLLERGVKVDGTTPRGYTPLHGACAGGHARLVTLLLKNKADAKARTKNGWTPMLLAADQVRPEHEEENAPYQAVIRTLERAGVEVDVFAAIACNDVQRITSILRTEPKAGETRNPAGVPALHQAVKLDRKEIVKLLLDKGTDPDIRSKAKGIGHYDETALLQAAFWGRLEIAEMLIKRGARVNAKAARGVVPLHEAARMGHVDLARLLVKHGADANAKDDDGKTPLDWAEAGPYEVPPEMVQLLRDPGGKK